MQNEMTAGTFLSSWFAMISQKWSELKNVSRVWFLASGVALPLDPMRSPDLAEQVFFTINIWCRINSINSTAKGIWIYRYLQCIFSHLWEWLDFLSRVCDTSHHTCVCVFKMRPISPAQIRPSPKMKGGAQNTNVMWLLHRTTPTLIIHQILSFNSPVGEFQTKISRRWKNIFKNP